jgi:hypothetical protein
MNRRTFAAAAALSLLEGCKEAYPRFFDIEWDEEVLLHDGRIIWVHVKRTFERRSQFDQWDGIYRDTEISFDMDSVGKKYQRKFLRYQVNMIEFKDGYWYISLENTSGSPPEQVVDPSFPRLILAQDGAQRAATSWAELPDFPRHNLMPLTPSPEGVLQFANKRLTWQVKMAHWKKYPRAAGDTGLLIQHHTNK